MQVKEVATEGWAVVQREELLGCLARVDALEGRIRGLEDTLRRVREVSTAPCYLVPGRRMPRFVMQGREVLDVLEALR